MTPRSTGKKPKPRKAREWWLAKAGKFGPREIIVGRVDHKRDNVAASGKYLIRVREVLPAKRRKGKA